MGLTTKFLVDSTKYKQILETIRTDQYTPERINKDYFEELGYTNPTDFLVLSLLMDLQLLDEDGSPTKLFEKFQNKETSKQALASGIIVAYEDLLEANPTIYNASNDEIIELIGEKAESVKSEIILNYMASTFKALVNYAGQENIKNAWEEREIEKTTVEAVAEEASKTSSQNGKSDSNDIQATDPLVAEATDQPKNDTKSHHNQDDITEDEIPEEDQKMQEENKEVEAKERDTEEPTTNSGNPKERNADSKEADNDNSEYKDRYVENGIARDKTDSSDEENFTQEDSLLSSLASKMSQDISRVDKAFIKKATLLQKLERHDDAFFALDDVYSRYADSDNAALYTHASIALVSKMKTAEKLELTDELLTIYGNVVNRLQHSDSKEFIQPVDHAFIQRAEILLEENHDQEAIDALTAAIQRFNKTGRNLKSLENFMFEKAELLEELGREEEALLAYDKFLNRFDNR